MPQPEALNSSQIATYLDIQLSADRIHSQLPRVSRVIGRKLFLERRIEDIRKDLEIRVEGQAGSRRGLIPINEVGRILDRMIEEAEESRTNNINTGRGANLRRVGISRDVISKTIERWSK